MSPRCKSRAGDDPWPSIVKVLAAPVAFWISSSPAAVSVNVIDVVTLIVFALEPLSSAVVIAARNALSVATLNVLRTIRDSRPSRNSGRHRSCRSAVRLDRLLRNIGAPLKVYRESMLQNWTDCSHLDGAWAAVRLQPTSNT